MEQAEELARLKGKTLEPHEGYYRTNSGAWVVTFQEKDADGFDTGGPVCEVTFKGKAKRGEAYRAPDPEGQANAVGIAAVPQLVEALLAARQFIRNGVELGYIRMPDPEVPDSAHKTLPAVEGALKAAGVLA